MSVIFLNIFEDAEGLKSKGNSVNKFGIETKHLVCGDKLCSEYSELSESFQMLESLIFFDCNTDVMCIINYLKEIEKEEGPQILFLEFNKVISVLENNTTYCHAPAHHLGAFLYSYTNDLETAMSVTDSRCGGAIYHGILQEFFDKSKLDSVSVYEIAPTKICPFYDGKFTLDRYECLHGLGHGLTIFYDYDIFKALEHCSNFSDDWEIDACSNGVFMENIDGFLSLREDKFVQNDVFYPCNEIDDQFAPACYHHQNTFMLVQNNYSISDTFSDCDAIFPEEFIQYCYRGMGRQLAPVSSSIEIPLEFEKKFTNAIEICKKGQEQFQKNCLMGMVRVIVDQDSLDDGFEYCKFFTQEFKSDCYTLLGLWIKLSYDSRTDQLYQCSKSESFNTFDVCMNSSIKDWELIQG